MSKSTPAFLLAIQRSGTNMTVWSLEKHKDVHLYNEDNSDAFKQFGLKDFEDVRNLVESSNKEVVLFKSLKDTFRFKKLIKAFPDAKFLFLARHYNDVVGSNMKAFGGQPFEKLATPVINYIKQKHGFFNQAVSQEIKDEASERCRRLYKEDLTKESLFAIYWLNVNSMYFQLGMDKLNSVYLGLYEDMVANPQHEFEKICHHLEIEFDAELVNEVHSKSVKKHEVDIHPDIKKECDELWERIKAQKKKVHKGIVTDKKITLHLGVHKTASTLIQNISELNQEKFKEKGIKYLSLNSIASGRKNILGKFNQLLNGDPEAYTWFVKIFQDEINNCPENHIFISEENFLGIANVNTWFPNKRLYGNVHYFQLMQTIFPPQNTNILISLREQSSLIESLYSEAVTLNSYVGSFEEFSKLFDVEKLSWEYFIKHIKKAGFNNIDIINFDLIKKGRDYYLKNFFNLVDENLDINFNVDVYEHRGLNKLGLKILSYSNSFLSDEDKKRLKNFLRTEFTKTNSFELFTPDQKQEIQSFYDNEIDNILKGIKSN